MLRVAKAAVPKFKAAVAKLSGDPKLKKSKLHDLLTAMVKDGEKIRVIYTTGHWLDIDSLDDLVAAGRFR
jgi:phosphoenolpyruvate phosphomutase